MADSMDLKPLLLETDEEFRRLSVKHHELDQRLHVFNRGLGQNAVT